jgi:TPR repeat protein
MTAIRLLPIAIATAFLTMTGCADRQAPNAPVAQTKTESMGNRASRLREYRSALAAYTAGRHLLALRHFKAAAELGQVEAQYYTGLMYANGEGTDRNFDEAAKWYQKAAERNQPDALVQLARLHVIGLGVERDVGKALQLLERAANIYPSGEKRDEVIEQRVALQEAMESKPEPAAESSL